MTNDFMGLSITEAIERTPPLPKDDPPEPQTSIAKFPTEALPDALQTYVRECSDKLNFHADLLATSALFSYGFAMGNGLKLRVNDSWLEHFAVYCCLVAPSGTSKTHTLSNALKPLRNIESKYNAKYQTDVQEWSMLSKELRASTPKPLRRELLLNDATLEAVAKTHASNPNGLTVIRDEFASWLGDMDKYRNGSDVSAYLSSWSGQGFKVSRASKDEPLYVSEPCISVIGTTQPAFLPLLASNGKDRSGFLDRILVSYPDDSKARYPTEQAPDQSIVQSYIKSVEDLHGFTDNQRWVTHLNNDARLLFHKYRCANIDAINEAQFDFEKSLLAKFDNHALRICLALQGSKWALNECSGLDVIDGHTMSGAIEIAEWFKTNSYKVRYELQQQEPPDKYGRVKFLQSQGLSVRAISEQVGISKSQVQRILS